LGSRSDRPFNSHFYYCYQLGSFSWPAVEAFGDWTSWVEFFDSERIRTDPRIADWLANRLADTPSARWQQVKAEARADWFRALTKSIRATFKGRDTTGLSAAELESELDQAFEASVVARATTPV
jgi:hypothetical protein